MEAGLPGFQYFVSLEDIYKGDLHPRSVGASGCTEVRWSAFSAEMGKVTEIVTPLLMEVWGDHHFDTINGGLVDHHPPSAHQPAHFGWRDEGFCL